MLFRCSVFVGMAALAVPLGSVVYFQAALGVPAHATLHWLARRPAVRFVHLVGEVARRTMDLSVPAMKERMRKDLNLTHAQLEAYLALPPHPHNSDFVTDTQWAAQDTQVEHLSFMAADLADYWKSYIEVEKYLEAHPEALTQLDARKVVMVVGSRRSGTTSLQHLLSKHQDTWSPTMLDAGWPVPHSYTSGTEEEALTRYNNGIAIVSWLMSKEDMAIHPTLPHDLAEMDNFIHMAWAAMQRADPLYYRVSPTGAKPCMRSVFRRQRRVLAAMVHSRGVQAPYIVLKSPSLLQVLDDVVQEFPGVVFVQTHRAAASMIRSSAALTEMAADCIGNHPRTLEADGAAVRELIMEEVEAATLARRHLEAAGTVFVDVSLPRFIKDGFGEAVRIAEAAGMPPWSPAATEEVQGWLAGVEAAKKANKALPTGSVAVKRSLGFYGLGWEGATDWPPAYAARFGAWLNGTDASTPPPPLQP